MLSRSLGVALLLTTVGLTAVPPPVPPRPAADAVGERPARPQGGAALDGGADAGLVEAVAARVRALAGAPRDPAAAGGRQEPRPEPELTVLRRAAGGWVFGSAVLVAPQRAEAYPDGWLFVARPRGARWQVALEGEADFGRLSRQAPVLEPAERSTLAELAGPRDPRAEAGRPDYRTGMRLPYGLKQRWRYTGGPHPMSGTARSSIDLAGGDGRVRAAADGLAYSMCPRGRGWVRVVHDRGFATDYYHLENGIRADGTRVDEGQVLGHIGNDVACGGRSTGKHVHFALRRGGRYVDIDRYSFGKWSIRAGARAYDGFALHGSTRVAVDGTLRNYGALGPTEGVVDTDGGGVLNRRSGPGTRYPVVGTVRDGATVRIVCSARGSRHAGRGGYRSDLWNKLADGTWVADVYVWTGTGAPVNGYC